MSTSRRVTASFATLPPLFCCDIQVAGPILRIQPFCTVNALVGACAPAANVPLAVNVIDPQNQIICSAGPAPGATATMASAPCATPWTRPPPAIPGAKYQTTLVAA